MVVFRMHDSLPHLLTTSDLALRLGLRPETITTWRHQGHGPRYVKLGRRVLYRAEDVVAWIEANVRTSTSG